MQAKAPSLIPATILLVLALVSAGASSQVNSTTAPTLEIIANSQQVFVGQPFTLSWSSSNATVCTASGDWSGSEALSGRATLTANSAGRRSYALLCAGPGGTVSATARVGVEAPSLTLAESFLPNASTISTSEGAPYGDCNFWVQAAASCGHESNLGYGPTKVVRIYICLSGEVSNSACSQQPPVTGPLSDAMLQQIQAGISAFAGSGIRLIVRFTYNFGPIGPGAMDAPLDVIATHIDQLAPILLHNKDLIFALEAGFIGTWGEWHDSTNGNDTAAAQKLVLDKELGYFKGLFPILVRYPGDLIQYTGTLTPQPGLGIHDDYYASNSADGATWTPCAPRSGYCLDNYTTEQLQSYAASVSSTTMFAGEFGALDTTLQTCDALSAYSYTYQAQSINLFPFPTDIGTFLQSEGCATSFYNMVGTRIVLQSVNIIGDTTPGGRLYVAITMVNDGFGRVIRRRPATLLLSQGGRLVGGIEVPIERMDLRKLASSANPAPQTFQFNFMLPATLQPGLTSMALLFRDPAPSLSTQPAYALPLNSVDASNSAIFDPTTGYNWIATFECQ